MPDMRLIDANALTQRFEAMQECANMQDHVYLMGVLSMIDNTPTIDAVEVVRCRKCMNWQSDWECASGGPDDHFCTMIGRVTKPDFYCKHGEKLEVEG